MMMPETSHAKKGRQRHKHQPSERDLFFLFFLYFLSALVAQAKVHGYISYVTYVSLSL